MTHHQLDTHQKALQINLDQSVYGTLVEIGAGQEVAAWFFRVGAAAGTVAKTMSAYDMTVSDAIYGKSSRYVSEDRLTAMLDHEWRLLLERLDESRGETTCFFTFANTVTARNYHGTNVCHGWLGIRYQRQPRGEAHTIMLHVNMKDDTNLGQQKALGVLGVNLVYGASKGYTDLKSFVASLLDDLSIDRIDIDALSMNGSAFSALTKDEVTLSLLEQKVTPALAFDNTGRSVPAINLFYKHPVIIERGRFKHVHHLHLQLLESAVSYYKRENIPSEKEPLTVFEMSIDPANSAGSITLHEVSERLDKLRPFNKPVLVTSYSEGYHLTAYLRRYSPEPIRFAMGMGQLIQILSDKYYTELPGGIVDGLGRLVASKVKLYVNPMEVNALAQGLLAAEIDLEDWIVPEEGLANLSNTRPLNATRHLYSYLFEIGALVPMRGE
jgi:hypothetical protein